MNCSKDFKPDTITDSRYIAGDFFRLSAMNGYYKTDLGRIIMTYVDVSNTLLLLNKFESALSYKH